MSLSDQCYALLRTIPKGKVMTYKQVAEQLGKPKAYRAIATIIGKNPDIPNTPCHRVVGTNGHLRGYARGLKAKQSLLRAEGVDVSEDLKVDLKKFLYKTT